MSAMICCEGNIGAGKSTFCKEISRLLNYKVMYEPVATNPYLEKYYADPKRYALEMQYYLMSARFFQHQEGIDHCWRTGQSVLFDRSIYGDTVFCKRNFLDGNIEQIGYDNYLKMRDVMTRFLMIPQLVVFLDVKPEICLERIKQRSRNCETNIPLSYLQGLHELYSELMEYMESLGSKVVRLNWNEFMPFGEVVKYLKENKYISKPFEEYPEIKRDSAYLQSPRHMIPSHIADMPTY
jgi:deoxyadenosine/deoxycytidine kinase